MRSGAYYFRTTTPWWQARRNQTMKIAAVAYLPRFVVPRFVLFRGPVFPLSLLFDLFCAFFIGSPPVRYFKQVWRALQAENLRFESINGSYECTYCDQPLTRMLTIDFAPFSLAERAWVVLRYSPRSEPSASGRADCGYEFG